jgi:SAM-dependent methyltransferase
MDGQRLELADDSFDSGASMFGLVFFPDTAAGLRELRRVVRPGGLVAVGTWNVDRFPVFETVGAGLGAMVTGLERPEPTRAELGRPGPLGDAMRAAGFARVVVHPVLSHWRYPDPEEFFRSLPHWSPPVQPLFDAVPTDLIEQGAAAFAEAVAAIDDGEGVPTEALVAVGAVP